MSTLFTQAQFEDGFPEFAGTSPGQFDLWYCLAAELFNCFEGAKTPKAQELLMKYATAHVGIITCDGVNGAQLIEVKTMNSTEKYKAIEYNPDGFTLYRTGYGQMLMDYANLCYTGGYIEPFRELGHCRRTLTYA